MAPYGAEEKSRLLPEEYWNFIDWLVKQGPTFTKSSQEYLKEWRDQRGRTGGEKSMEGVPEFLDRYLDARFKGIENEIASLKDTVRLATESNARLVDMVQREVIAQGDRMNALDAKLDVKIDEVRKEIRESRRFLAATTLAGMGVLAAIMSVIFQVIK